MVALAPMPNRDAALWRRLGDALRPRPRVRPSEWAEANVMLAAKQGAQTLGPYACGHYPWLRAFHDALIDHPRFAGVCAPKRSQGGITLAMLNVMGAGVATRDGSLLYVIGRDSDAKYMVTNRWDPIVQGCEVLRERFRRGAEASREIMLERPFDGGQVDFVGAGSPGAVSSRTYTRIVVDEVDIGLQNFPSSFGDLHEFVCGRQGAIYRGSEMWLFGHPTLAGIGIDHLFRTYSDQSEWCFDCPLPGCGRIVRPSHRLIDFRRTFADGVKDAASAALVCPHCAREISDAARQRAVWEPETFRGGRAGGTGRLVSPLGAEEALRRRYLGFALNGLVDPYRPIVYFAEKLAAARTPKARQSVLNVTFGEAYTEATAVLTLESVRTMFRSAEGLGERGRVIVPGGRLGVRFVTAGSDVQEPRDNPRIYTAVCAWAASGDVYVTALAILQGFSAWHEFLRVQAVEVGAGDDGRGGQTMARTLGIAHAGIDDAWLSGRVKEACRTSGGGLLHSAATSARIHCVPVRHVPKSTVNRDVPFLLRDERKRTHPMRPELGPIDMYDLHRHSWVDRVLQRIPARRIHVLCGAPPELTAHMTANLLRPVKSTTGWAGAGGDGELEWHKPDEMRDDWMQAIVYAESMAAIKCGLDRIEQMTLDGVDVTRGQRGQQLKVPSLVRRRGW